MPEPFAVFTDGDAFRASTQCIPRIEGGADLRMWLGSEVHAAFCDSVDTARRASNAFLHPEGGRIVKATRDSLENALRICSESVVST